MTDIDPKVIKKTQDTLGKLIKRPPLTDKLLSRPPFRFIHDICSALIRSTGIMKGLFTTEELNADAIKDKDSKIAFLKKVIDFLTAAHDRSPNVKISSIISGKEPERTNALLQLLAEAVNKNIDNTACVNKALGISQMPNESPAKGDKKERKKDLSATKGTTPKRTSAIDIRRRSSLTSRSKDKNDKSKDKNEDLLKKLLTKSKTGSDSGTDVTKEVAVKTDNDVENKMEVKLPGSINEGSPCSGGSRPTTVETEAVVSPTSVQSRANRPPSAKGPKKPLNESPQIENFIAKSESPAMISPEQSPAKIDTPDPPKLAEFPKVEPKDRLEQTGSKEGLLSTTVTGIIVENEVLSDDDDDKDDDDFGEERVGAGALEDGDENIAGIRLAQASGGEGDFSEVEASGQVNGSLVNKLLKTQRELGGENTLHLKGSKSSNLLVVNEAAKKRDREATEREMEKLSQILQNLTRSALPLGKLIDLMQEDLESIQMEYREWKEEDERNQEELRKLESQNNPHIAELQSELRGLEQKQMEYRKAIISMKARILKNNETIQQMLIQASEAS